MALSKSMWISNGTSLACDQLTELLQGRRGWLKIKCTVEICWLHLVVEIVSTFSNSQTSDLKQTRTQKSWLPSKMTKSSSRWRPRKGLLRLTTAPSFQEVIRQLEILSFYSQELEWKLRSPLKNRISLRKWKTNIWYRSQRSTKSHSRWRVGTPDHTWRCPAGWEWINHEHVSPKCPGPTWENRFIKRPAEVPMTCPGAVPSKPEVSSACMST